MRKLLKIVKEAKCLFLEGSPSYLPKLFSGHQGNSLNIVSGDRIGLNKTSPTGAIQNKYPHYRSRIRRYLLNVEAPHEKFPVRWPTSPIFGAVTYLNQRGPTPPYAPSNPRASLILSRPNKTRNFPSYYALTQSYVLVLAKQGGHCWRRGCGLWGA